jgi:hypothetical protein
MLILEFDSRSTNLENIISIFLLLKNRLYLHGFCLFAEDLVLSRNGAACLISLHIVSHHSQSFDKSLPIDYLGPSLQDLNK